MTIGKKLYSGFGAIVAIMIALFVVSVLTISREHTARSLASATLTDLTTIENIRFHVMLEELVLRNFLLSGDVRDEGELASVHTTINTQLRDAESHATDPALRSTLLRVEDAEHGWMDDFAKPMIAKRHQVDGGDATVSDLQIFYLQQNPGAWMNKTSSLLDDAKNTISAAHDRSRQIGAKCHRGEHVAEHRGNPHRDPSGAGDCVFYFAFDHAASEPLDRSGARNRGYRKHRSDHRYSPRR